jgi:hypothetical protein
MSASATHTLLTVAVQHLWHAALLLALVLLVVQRAPQRRGTFVAAVRGLRTGRGVAAAGAAAPRSGHRS